MPVGYFRPRPTSAIASPGDTNQLPALPADGVLLVPVIGQSWVARVEGGSWALADYEQNNQFRSSRVWVKPDQTLVNNGAWEYINETTNNANPPGFGGSTIRPVIIQMASILESLYPDTDIYFAFFGLGGTGLNEVTEWAVGGTLRQLFIEYILRPVLADLTLLNVPIQVLPLFTAFGHADADIPADANAFAGRLLTNNDSLIEEIRAELGIVDLPVGIFRLRDNWNVTTPEWSIIDGQIDLMATEDTVFVLDADDYTDGTDNLHLGGLGTRQLAIDYVFKGIQSGLSTYTPALTLLSIRLTGTDGDADQRIDLTYNKTLDVDSVPALGDLALSDGRTVTNVEIIGAISRFTFDTPFALADAPTGSYTPGVNPIQSGAEQAAAFSNIAITNALQAVSSPGTVMTFTTSANVSESGGVYTAATGGGSYNWFMVGVETIPASTDGSVELDSGGTNMVLGFDVDATLQAFNDSEGYNVFVWVLSGNYYTRIAGGGSTDSGIAYAAGDLTRLRRGGTTIFAEKSSDGGTTWDPVNSFSIPALETAQIYAKVNFGANGQSVQDIILR
ncbi:MAG: hypothetical protein AAGA46_17100 [Cyanobacteria bacterium P01_F01_bin.13]